MSADGRRDGGGCATVVSRRRKTGRRMGRRHGAPPTPPARRRTNTADAVLVRCQHAGARALEGVPQVAVEVVVAGEQDTPALAKGNRGDAAAGGVGGVGCVSEKRVCVREARLGHAGQPGRVGQQAGGVVYIFGVDFRRLAASSRCSLFSLSFLFSSLPPPQHSPLPNVGRVERLQLLRSSNVVELAGGIVRPRGKGKASGEEVDGINVRVVALEGQRGAAHAAVPQFRRGIAGARHKNLPGWLWGEREEKMT